MWICREEDVKTNYLMVKCALENYPEAMPSAYFWADVLLEVNIKFSSKLMRPPGEGSAVDP
jgi:hypothetical protein